MILIELFALLLLIYIILLLSYSLIFGAPYAAIGKSRMTAMFDLLDVVKGKNSIDIGSGDGRIVIAASKKGLIASGVEINPMLYIVSWANIKLTGAKRTKILLSDMWRTDYSTYDYITVWGTKHMIKNLEKKLRKELKPGAKVVSNHFRFPNWKFTKNKNDVYLYIQKK